MTVHKLEFKPGIIKDDTPLASEGGWIDADKVRFRRGRPETIGGWEKVTSTPFSGIARGSIAWQTLTGEKVAAWGTANNLYAHIGGLIADITPPHTECWLFNPFTTRNGSTSVTVTNAIYTPSTDTATTVPHGLKAGDSVTFAFASAAGGITVGGTYAVTSIPTPSTFTITHGSAATSTVTTPAGGHVKFTATLAAGNVDGSGASGYGVGAYGSGTYGAGTTADTLPRIWNLSQWGEFLLANPTGYGLFEYQPALGYPELVLDGGFSAISNWETTGGAGVAGGGWNVAAGVATHSAGTAGWIGQRISTSFKGGYTYRVTFDLTRTAGSVRFAMTSSVGGSVYLSPPLSVAGSYSFLVRCPPGAPQWIWFDALSTFAGTIDNLSIKLESRAYRIVEAPASAYGMFVDQNRVVVLMATVNAAGTFDPLLVRWSDQENNRTWVPDSANVAGEQQLALGSRVVGGINARAQNLIWTDVSLYTMQWTGETGFVYSIRSAGEGCGLIGPLAATEQNGVAYWMSNSGQFYQYAGGVPQPLDCSLKADVFGNIASGQESKAAAWVNARYGEIWWHYADGRDGTEVSRYAAYNYLEGHWTAGTFPRSSWVGAGIFEFPIGLGTDGYLYYHEKGHSADGGVLTATLTSAFMDIDDGDTLMAIRRIAPEFQGQLGAVSVSLLAKSWPPDNVITVGPLVRSTTTQFLDCRLLARQVAVRLSSSAAPSAWRLGVMQVEGRPTQAKR